MRFEPKLQVFAELLNTTLAPSLATRFFMFAEHYYSSDLNLCGTFFLFNLSQKEYYLLILKNNLFKILTLSLMR